MAKILVLPKEVADSDVNKQRTADILISILNVDSIVVRNIISKSLKNNDFK